MALPSSRQHHNSHRTADRFSRLASSDSPGQNGRLTIGLLLLLICNQTLKGEESSAKATPQHWAFRPLNRSVISTSSVNTTLDDLILRRLKVRQLDFAPQADRRSLCRRLYLDLIGLPPAPTEVDQFVNDSSPQAIEKLVDRLLSSPAYGERWGRQWLDVVGYADSNGYIRHDSPRPLAYRYRDYVIQSLNDDLPYDQFWKEQLAGDELVDTAELDNLTADQLRTLIATHYLRNPPDGTDDTEGNEITRVMERYAVLESLLQTSMSAMFGMTIDCARCHDHKFDPIPQQDYYALQAIFYPAFNVKEWVQPKNRWIYSVGKADVENWRESHKTADREIARVRDEHQAWITANRPPGDLHWRDDFSANSLKEYWSPVAPGDTPPDAIPKTVLDIDQRPGARLANGRLSLFAAASGDSRWLATQRRFDWTPDAIGEWIQVSFDLIESRGPNGQPAERVGYYIALHDRDDDSAIDGGNLLFDGNPAGGATVVLDYPGSDQKSLGVIGKSGYLPGRNFGVRITRTSETECLLQQIVGGELEPNTITLSTALLPDGGFGFELCCSRDFTVDNLAIESSIQSPGDAARDLIHQEYQSQLMQRQEQLKTAIAAIDSKRLPEPQKLAFATDLSTTLPSVPLLKRGDYFQPGDLVTAGPLSALSDPESPFQPEARTRTTGRRLAFANWATRLNSRPAALLARVQVDRIWRGHFGKGLVPSPENFGQSGVAPADPALMDWLAAHLIDNGWRQKPIHRLIVLSKTYQQSSEATTHNLELDPDNNFYSRYPMHRLQAEQIRDSMLAVAGVLNLKRGGPAVEIVDQGNRQIILKPQEGEGPYEADRRSIYTRYRRSQPLTFLRTFDQASADPNCVVRGNSAVVAQSLALLNGDFAIRMGRELSRQVRSEVDPANEAALITRVFERAYARPPSSAELEQSKRFLDAQTARRGKDSRSDSFCAFCQTILASNEFLYVP